MNGEAETAQRARGAPMLALLAVPLAWTLGRVAAIGLLPASEALDGVVPVPAVAIAEISAARIDSGAGHQRDDCQAPDPQLSPGRFAHVKVSPLHLAALSPIGGSVSVPDGEPLARENLSSAAPLLPALRPTSTVPATHRRWSMDGWLLLRDDAAATDRNGLAVPVYGASQLGAVLRYSLLPASLHRPAAYLRGVQALNAAETDIAAGIALRPFPGVPVDAHLEARATVRGASAIVRPAAMLTAGIDDAALPLGFAARGYAQAGYVGGPDGTGFADGSLVAERRVVRIGDVPLTAGAGLWGGAQRGAMRLDIGPTAGVRFRLGSGAGRIAIDYRVRVAGGAAPASGVALTISAGF